MGSCNSQLIDTTLYPEKVLSMKICDIYDHFLYNIIRYRQGWRGEDIFSIVEHWPYPMRYDDMKETMRKSMLIIYNHTNSPKITEHIWNATLLYHLPFGDEHPLWSTIDVGIGSTSCPLVKKCLSLPIESLGEYINRDIEIPV